MASGVGRRRVAQRHRRRPTCAGAAAAGPAVGLSKVVPGLLIVLSGPAAARKQPAIRQFAAQRQQRRFGALHVLHHLTGDCQAEPLTQCRSRLGASPWVAFSKVPAPAGQLSYTGLVVRM